MKKDEAELIRQIDRSEEIESVYLMRGDQLIQEQAGHETPGWSEAEQNQMISRFREVLEHGGHAYGAFDGVVLAGFGLLAADWRGKDHDHLQVDLMYVSRNYRRRAIGRRLMGCLKREAVSRGARYLYISSTETQSAVHFYQSSGSRLAEYRDPDLYELEPLDIHMTIELAQPVQGRLYDLVPMTRSYAEAIGTWIYPPPYSMYTIGSGAEELAEMLTGDYRAALDRSGELIGYICTGSAARVPGGYSRGLYHDDWLDLGLGLRPDLTGMGWGTGYVEEAVVYAMSGGPRKGLQLAVAAFNERAIQTYERSGFRYVEEFMSRGPAGDIPFVHMRRRV
ncbi:GNAT family N-acetyltransferase [Paenibacillus lacisoli]|nr:GNAT family N-acetyltransferase [Paenibacillus sp. JX-17]